MFKKIIILLAITSFTSQLYAQDLLKTLSDAFKNNSKINAQRASFNASKQDVNISRSEFLPSITLSGDKATQQDTKRKNLSGTSLQDTSTTPENFLFVAYFSRHAAIRFFNLVLIFLSSQYSSHSFDNSAILDITLSVNSLKFS